MGKLIHRLWSSFKDWELKIRLKPIPNADCFNSTKSCPSFLPCFEGSINVSVQLRTQNFELPAFQMTGLIFISIMENKIVMSKDKIFAGVLTGIAAGAVLALMFTEKGSSIRKKMYSKGKDAAETLKDAFNDFINRIQEKTGMV